MKWWHYALVGLALAAGGYAFGRYATPTKTVTLDREVVHTVAVADTHAEQQVRELTAQLQELKLQDLRNTVWRVERTVVTQADGTKVEHETRATEEKHEVQVERATQVNVDLSRVQVADTHAQVSTERIATHETVVEHDAPQWFAGVVATVSPGAPDPLSSISAGIMVGRHIVGPLALGLSVTVPVNKPVQVPTFGLSLTMSF